MVKKRADDVHHRQLSHGPGATWAVVRGVYTLVCGSIPPRSIIRGGSRLAGGAL